MYMHNNHCHRVTAHLQFITITIIIIIILGISFMQGIYTYVPEANRGPREHRVVAILVLLFLVLISLVPALTPLYLYVSIFRSMCAVPNMAVFCSSLTSWLSGILLTYFLNDFEMVPVAPIVIIIIIMSSGVGSTSSSSNSSSSSSSSSSSTVGCDAHGNARMYSEFSSKRLNERNRILSRH
jgi:hypothetical protein